MISELNEAERVAALIEILKQCDGQEHAIKVEENGWVRNHWAFYLAIATLIALSTRGVSSAFEPGRIPIGAQAGLCIGVIFLALVSLCATDLFMQQMLQMRWTYYGVRERLLRATKALELDNSRSWGVKEPLSKHEVMLISEIANSDDWRRLTRPDATFKGRLAHLLLGHFSVLGLCMICLAAFLEAWAILVFLPLAAVSGFWALMKFKSVRDDDRKHFLPASV